MAVASRQLIQSLDRGLQILEYVAEQGRPVRLSELAQLLGVEKSSAHRLASTLAVRGYLRQDSKSPGFLLDDKVFTLAGSLDLQRDARQQARRYLQTLVKETGETAHMAVRCRAQAVLVDHEFGSHPVAVTTRWGNSEPLHCTALGKALLAGMNKTQLQEILGKQLKRYTKNTITRLDDLMKECRLTKERDIAFDRAEFRQDTNCIASSVHDFRGRVVAAIGISGPAHRLSGRLLQRCAQVVKKCARELSGELGYCQDTSKR